MTSNKMPSMVPDNVPNNLLNNLPNNGAPDLISGLAKMQPKNITKVVDNISHRNIPYMNKSYGKQPKNKYPETIIRGDINDFKVEKNAIEIFGKTLSKKYVYIIGAVVIAVLLYFLWKWYNKKNDIEEEDHDEEDDVNYDQQMRMQNIQRMRNMPDIRQLQMMKQMRERSGQQVDTRTKIPPYMSQQMQQHNVQQMQQHNIQQTPQENIQQIPQTQIQQIQQIPQIPQIPQQIPQQIQQIPQTQQIPQYMQNNNSMSVEQFNNAIKKASNDL
jgi:hypothetical protein